MLSRSLIARSWRPTYCLRCASRFTSTSTATGSAISDNDPTKPPEPPMMANIRADLKNAMRNKDKNRLSILRAVLTDLSGRVKTSSHPLTQSSVLQVLSKHASQGEESAKSFDAAKRTDLAQKESEQVKVLHEYMLGIEKASEEEMDQVVHRLVWKDGVEQKPQMRNLRDSAVRILEVDKGKAIDMKLLMGIIKKYMVT